MNAINNDMNTGKIKRYHFREWHSQWKQCVVAAAKLKQFKSFVIYHREQLARVQITLKINSDESNKSSRMNIITIIKNEGKSETGEKKRAQNEIEAI